MCTKKPKEAIVGQIGENTLLILYRIYLNKTIMKKIKLKKITQITFLLATILSLISWNIPPSKSIKVNGLLFEDLNKNGKLDAYEDYRLPINERIKDLISKLTDEEKVTLLIGDGMPGYDKATLKPTKDETRVPGAAGVTGSVNRLGIPVLVLADGPAGLRISAKRENTAATFYATAFPVGTSLASTWNESLIFTVGKAIGNEVKEYGVDVILGPGMNIHRNPLCGRNFEYYSEDPLLTGKIAASMVKGIQSNGVGTSIKHFAANNQETNRLSINEHISERAMREIYLRGFEIAVKEAQPWTVMSSYNLINGTYTSQRKDLLTTILRDEWKFNGLVVSDWFGGYDGVNLGTSLEGVSDVAGQFSAGNDLLMPGTFNQKKASLEVLKSGKLSKETINKNLEKYLELVFKSPTMNKYKYSNKPNSKLHAKITRDVAAEGMVLLKNNKATLPFTSKKTPLAVFGVTSYNFIEGGSGSGNVNEAYTVSLLDGFTNAGFSVDKELEDAYNPYVKKLKAIELERREKNGGFMATSIRMKELEISKEMIDKKANSSEIAVVTIGRDPGESADRNLKEDYYLQPDELNLLNNVSELFHSKGKKVVVILNVGGVIEVDSWQNKVDAILLPWQSGQEGGNSVVDVFTGKVNPSGKLTMTFPVKYEDIESSKNFPGTPPENPKEVTYKEGIYVGYRYFKTFNVAPSYEFGYGLSYTSFDFSDVKLSSKNFDKKISLSLMVKNTGKMPGKEVVQLYLSAPSQSIDKPSCELKAFAKTKLLAPGESQLITLKLNSRDLASFIPSKNAWITESGSYKIAVGNSSSNIYKTVDFDLANEIVVEKVNPTFEPDLQFEDLKH
jgi:beta-glucosidase